MRGVAAQTADLLGLSPHRSPDGLRGRRQEKTTPAGGGCLEENALLTSRGQRSGWADCLETAERQQELNKPAVATQQRWEKYPHSVFK